MKTIKNLEVKVTYTVSLSDVEVPDDVYDALSECYEVFGFVSQASMSDAESVASDWLNDNIFQDDSMDWEYEIEEFK